MSSVVALLLLQTVVCTAVAMRPQAMTVRDFSSSSSLTHDAAAFTMGSAIGELLREICHSWVPCSRASMYCYSQHRCQRAEAQKPDTGFQTESPPKPLVPTRELSLPPPFTSPKQRRSASYLRRMRYDLQFRLPFLFGMWRYFFGFAPYFDEWDWN